MATAGENIEAERYVGRALSRWTNESDVSNYDVSPSTCVLCSVLFSAGGKQVTSANSM
jgi:hypothetical protein